MTESLPDTGLALGTAGAVERPPSPAGEADKKLAEDWYTWGFQAGLDSARSAPSPAALDPARDIFLKVLRRYGGEPYTHVAIDAAWNAALSCSEAPVAWEDIATQLYAVDGHGFWPNGASEQQKEAYEIRAKAVAALYAAPSPAALEPVTVERCAKEAETWQGLKGSKLAEKIRALASPVSSTYDDSVSAEDVQARKSGISTGQGLAMTSIA